VGQLSKTCVYTVAVKKRRGETGKMRKQGMRGKRGNLIARG
jgi:hypothetical protein